MHDGRVRLAAIVRRDWSDVSCSSRATTVVGRCARMMTSGCRSTPRSCRRHRRIYSPSLGPIRRSASRITTHSSSTRRRRRIPSGRRMPRLWRGGRDPVHCHCSCAPRVSPLLLWLTGPMFRATSAWALSLATVPDSAPEPIPLVTYASTWSHRRSVTPVSSPHSTVAARRKTFESSSTTSRSASTPSSRSRREYRGLFGVALTTDRVVLIASKAGPPPRGPASDLDARNPCLEVPDSRRALTMKWPSQAQGVHEHQQAHRSRSPRRLALAVRVRRTGCSDRAAEGRCTKRRSPERKSARHSQRYSDSSIERAGESTSTTRGSRSPLMWGGSTRTPRTVNRSFSTEPTTPRPTSVLTVRNASGVIIGSQHRACRRVVGLSGQSYAARQHERYVTPTCGSVAQAAASGAAFDAWLGTSRTW